MNKQLLYSIVACLLIATGAYAQDDYNTRVKKYIDQYYALAIDEQKTSGIPASITLGQGILETEAGASELMTKANNHFGIKCKNGWIGETFLHTDDAKDECFKKYRCAADSYKDHSEHLKKNPRYAPLFACATTDYASWAVGLKKCGYATNPQYAQRLIKIIEDFHLQEYTYTAIDSGKNNYPVLVLKPQAKTAVPADAKGDKDDVEEDDDSTANVTVPIPVTHTPVAAKAVVRDTAIQGSAIVVTIDTVKPAAAVDTTSVVIQQPVTTEQDRAEADVDTTHIVIVNGLKAFYAYKGDMLLKYAVKYKMRYPQLLELNDLPDAAVPFDMYIYIQKKLSTGTQEKHTVAEGECMLSIAQSEGMQLKKLAALNLLLPGEEPATGTVLELQNATTKKPDVKVDAPAPAQTAGTTISFDSATANAGDYVDTRKKAPTAPAGKNVVAAQPVTPTPAPATPVADAGTKEPGSDAGESKAPVSPADPQQPQLKKAKTTLVLKDSKFYTVKRGDTAYSIAKTHNISVHDLMKWNNVDVEDIRAGQQLKIKP